LSDRENYSIVTLKGCYLFLERLGNGIFHPSPPKSDRKCSGAQFVQRSPISIWPKGIKEASTSPKIARKRRKLKKVSPKQMIIMSQPGKKSNEGGTFNSEEWPGFEHFFGGPAAFKSIMSNDSEVSPAESNSLPSEETPAEKVRKVYYLKIYIQCTIISHVLDYYSYY